MLDQNTDRMWFVIGALVVGAGIILLANKAMPEIFASVASSFEEVSDNATSSISDIKVLDGNLLTLATEHKYTFSNGANGIVGNMTKIDSGEVLTHDTMFEKMYVVPGKSYAFYSEEGLYNINIAYYSHTNEYLGGKRLPGVANTYLVAEAPSTAAYARVSARDGGLPKIEGSIVEPAWSSLTSTWVFKEVDADFIPEGF